MIKEEELNRRISIAKSIDDLIDISDYTHKHKFTKDLYNVTHTVSELHNIPFTILTGLRNKYSYNAGNKSWMEYIDSKVKEIQPNYTGESPWILECICCGGKQEKPSRESLVRSLGLGGNDDKKNGGMCTDCSKAEKRKPHGYRTPEQVEKMREVQIVKNLGFDSVEEWSKSKIEKDAYYAAVDAMSRTNLRLYNPKEYERYMANRWDGTNYESGLTIEHKTPKIICFQKGWSVKKAAHISNLKVVTQKENNRLWKEYAKKNNYKYSKKVKKTTHNFW